MWLSYRQRIPRCWGPGAALRSAPGWYGVGPLARFGEGGEPDELGTAGRRCSPGVSCLLQRVGSVPWRLGFGRLEATKVASTVAAFVRFETDGHGGTLLVPWLGADDGCAHDDQDPEDD